MAASAPDMRRMSTALTGWVLFGVVMAVLPVAFNGISAATGNQPFTWEAVLGHGELLIVSVGITAAASSRLLIDGIHPTVRVLLLGAGFIIVAIASLWFAQVETLVRNKAAINTDLVVVGSLVVFVSALVTGGFCVYTSEMASWTR